MIRSALCSLLLLKLKLSISIPTNVDTHPLKNVKKKRDFPTWHSLWAALLRWKLSSRLDRHTKRKMNVDDDEFVMKRLVNYYWDFCRVCAPRRKRQASCHQFRALNDLAHQSPSILTCVGLWLELTRVFDLIQMRWFRARFGRCHPKERLSDILTWKLNRFKFSLAILFFSSRMPRCQVVYDNRLQLIAKVACARALKLHLFFSR